MVESTPKRPSIFERLRTIEVRPGGAFLLGLAITVSLYGAMLLWWLVFGLWSTLFDANQPLGISYDARNHFTLSLLLASVIIGWRWIRRDEIHGLETFAADSNLPDDAVVEMIRIAYVPTLRSRSASIAIALLVGILMIGMTADDPGSFLSMVFWDAHHVWAIAINVALFSIMVQSAFIATAGLKILDVILSSLPEIDLLDRDGMSRIGRFGFPGALLWLVGSSLASTLAWGMATVWPLLAVLSATLAIATFSLLRPVQIVRARIRVAKQAELDRIRQRINETKETTLSGKARASEEATLLADLIAYESRIESVREWPFDVPTMLRFGALSLLAVGSWLGGAVVERALGAVLG